MRLAAVLLVACSSTTRPAAHEPAPPPGLTTSTTEQLANHTHTCADAALGLENATRGVRAPEQDVFDSLRDSCVEDAWSTAAVDCFAEMAEGELGTCARHLTDRARETIFATLSGKQGGSVVITKARLQQLNVGVPACDQIVSAVTVVLTCNGMSLDDRLQLGNETAEFWSLPTSRLSREDKLRMSEVCGQSLASLQQHALGAGCML
jgi:hypothetical protein